jgi:hypothetical protein
MNSTSIQINELNLHVPGLTREQGRKLGEAVAQRLAELKPRLEPRRIDSLSVCVPCGGSSAARIADLIARNIQRSLQ